MPVLTELQLLAELLIMLSLLGGRTAAFLVAIAAGSAALAAVRVANVTFVAVPDGAAVAAACRADVAVADHLYLFA
jgi:hypothetical protein